MGSNEHLEKTGLAFNSRMRTVFHKFMNKTSMHGCGYINMSRHLFTKILWTILTFAATVVLVIHLYIIIYDFLRWQINTKVSLGFNNLRFPAVTLCNVNTMRKSTVGQFATQDMIDLIDIVNPDNILRSLDDVADDLLEDGITSNRHISQTVNTNINDTIAFTNATYQDSVEGLYRGKQVIDDQADHSIFTAVLQDDEWTTARSFESFVNVLFRYMYMKLPRGKRHRAGHLLGDMLLSCTFNDKMCYARNFTLYPTSMYGNCYTLDSDKLVARRPGPNGGLTLMINLQTDEFIHGITNGYGAKLVVHDAGTIPLPEQEGIFVSAGTETNIRLKKTTVSRLGYPYGKCRDGDGFNKLYGMGYNVKLCNKACFATHIFEQCKCWHFRHEFMIVRTKKRFNLCATTKEVNCMTKALLAYNRKAIPCDCANPCTDVYYSTSVSSRQWPTETYATLLQKLVCRTRSTQCNQTVSDEHDYRKNFLRLNIFYETLNFELVEEEPLVNKFTFLSSIGGALGLWIGLSMLSVCELLQLITEMVTCLILKCIVKGSRRKTDAVANFSS